MGSPFTDIWFFAENWLNGGSVINTNKYIRKRNGPGEHDFWSELHSWRSISQSTEAHKGHTWGAQPCYLRLTAKAWLTVAASPSSLPSVRSAHLYIKLNKYLKNVGLKGSQVIGPVHFNVFFCLQGLQFTWTHITYDLFFFFLFLVSMENIGEQGKILWWLQR